MQKGNRWILVVNDNNFLSKIRYRLSVKFFTKMHAKERHLRCISPLLFCSSGKSTISVETSTSTIHDQNKDLFLRRLSLIKQVFDCCKLKHVMAHRDAEL